MMRAGPIVAFLVALGCSGGLALAADATDFPASSDYEILDGEGARRIGHAHYEFHASGRRTYVLRADSRFESGETDVEEDEIDATVSGTLTTVARYRHDYFAADGALERTAEADFHRGDGSCAVYSGGHAQVTSGKFDFPPDTYTGSTVVLPLTAHLRRGFGGAVTFHNFNCVPGPTLLTVKAYPPASSRWTHYPGELAVVRLKPDFGWWSVLIAPFVPRMDAYFAPSRRWAYVGGKSGRYYEGPEVTLVLELAGQSDALAVDRRRAP
jgi:hypothetical protein